MKKKFLLPTILLICTAAFVSCVPTGQSDIDATQSDTSTPTQTENNDENEYFDENQGEWDTEG